MKITMRGEHHRAPAVDVGELAVERRRRGRGEQIGGHHPGQVLDVVEGAAHGRQGGRDDGLIERAQKHRQHQADDDGAGFGMATARGSAPAPEPCCRDDPSPFLSAASALSAICPACRPWRCLGAKPKPAQGPCLADQLCRVIRRQRWSGCRARQPPSPSSLRATVPAQRVDARGDHVLVIVVDVTAEPRSAALCLRNAARSRSARVRLVSMRTSRSRSTGACSRADSRVSISRTWRSAVRSEPVDQRDIVRLQRAAALAGDLTPSRNRFHALAVMPERHAVETGIERAERHLAMGEDARDREALRIHLARADDAGAVERRIGFGADVR